VGGLEGRSEGGRVGMHGKETMKGKDGLVRVIAIQQLMFGIL